MKLFRLLAAIPTLLVLVQCSTGNQNINPNVKPSVKKETLPFLGSFQVHRYTFENGLRLLVVVDPSSPTFAYQTWYGVGSRNEVPGFTGLAHLFEHMMFKETKHLKEGEFDRKLESAGAEGKNAFTSQDYTAYIQELPKDQLELIARLEADRMNYLVVQDAAFKTEREVVQNERRWRNENSPDGLIQQELFGLAFSQHPYHWPVIGYQEDLNRMTAQDASKFYRKFYSPNHATIVVVGDLDPDQVKEVILRNYGTLSKQPDEPNIAKKEPPQTQERRKTLKLNIQVEKLLMGYHVPELTHPDTPTLEMLQQLLTGGKSSRLYRALVNTGVASAVESYEMDSHDPSLFLIGANLQKGKKTSEAEKIILKELATLEKTLISEEELSRARNKFNFAFFESMDSNYEKAAFLGQYETQTGDFLDGIKLHDKIQQITPKDIQNVVRRYFHPKSRTVIVGVQK